MSMDYFNEKETVKKRQPNKRTEAKITKSESFKQTFEHFIEAKVKQGLRPKSLNQIVIVYKSIETYHTETSDSQLLLAKA
jgi:integrase/recombinase XerD